MILLDDLIALIESKTRSTIPDPPTKERDGKFVCNNNTPPPEGRPE